MHNEARNNRYKKKGFKAIDADSEDYDEENCD
jgi:hypothetical protein